jgi:hypothetical protein
MEEVVERPVYRNLFRQASHETRLSPTVPSDSEESDNENEHHQRPLPRIVGVLVKKDIEVKTKGQSVSVQPEEVTADGGTSQNENKNVSSSPKSETEKAVTIAGHGADQGYTQEEDRPATFHENDLQDDMDVSVVGQKTESPITTHQTEIEEFKQEDEKHDHQTESVGTLKGKEIRACKVKNISHGRDGILGFAVLS